MLSELVEVLIELLDWLLGELLGLDELKLLELLDDEELELLLLELLLELLDELDDELDELLSSESLRARM